jgi:hypothetical protein
MANYGLCGECGMPLMERGMCNECGWMEENLHGGQKKLDVAPPFGKLTSADFKKLRKMKHTKEEGYVQEDHEVSMADSSLSDIIRNAEELLQKIGSEEKDLPAWIQDHITRAQELLDQVNTNYYDEEESSEHGHEHGDLSLAGMMEDLFEAKKKPSAGLSKKQKSAVAKKARAGKDVGKKGKGFEKVASKAAKKYGSAEKGRKVAAAAMWRGVKARAKK